ncbi:inositol monophosphatase family protein [Reinekea blandensis]|uniref:Putative monophosphatase n=1 Tax=Reinekea blandensis MED297 TaxID=314283 RepID=A4BFX3_9GAMM|nr:inositol monophosphatase family protein [Reinekea blandensis]EAR08991.1 putative monophosphatase [Reinekea sp. MED297] [Reinekea blandensis MED297]
MTSFSSLAIDHCRQALEAALNAAEQQFVQVDRQALTIHRKRGGESEASQVVTDLDIAIEKSIYQALQPVSDELSLAWLGEESSDSLEDESHHSRLTASAFWCVDPLDGTLSFIEDGQGYSVAIALVAQDGTPLLGGVLHPPSGQRWLSWRLSAPTPAVTVKETLTFFTDTGFFKQPAFAPFMQQLTGFARQLGYSNVQMVSDRGAVMNAVGVLQSSHAFYLKLPKANRGGGALWDFAASAGLFAATGKPCSDAFGRPLPLNSAESLYLNRTGVVFASDPALHSALLEFIAPWLSV